MTCSSRYDRQARGVGVAMPCATVVACRVSGTREWMTAGAMDGDRRWAESRFGDLEAFILDFLMGGSRAGERVRKPSGQPAGHGSRACVFSQASTGRC